jgi:uncharacterized OsmC-like protein
LTSRTWQAFLSVVEYTRYGTGEKGSVKMNNVNTKEMERFFLAVQKDPTQAKKSKRVTGSWVFEQGKPQFVSTLEYPAGSVVLNGELPAFAGGWGTSPDPIQYCLYGLAACFAATFVATAANEGVQLTKLEVAAENWMDLRKQMGLAKDNIIEKVKFTVHAQGASRARLEKIVALAEERCPGIECLTRSVPMEVELRG